MEGKVKWFNKEKGYGFIMHSDEENIFVHYSNILVEGFKTLKEGDTVKFELATGEKGLHATNVERVQ